MANSIIVKDLVKRYDSCIAVKGVSFTVKAGEVVGFLGPNGAGKSTTMRMITGFIQPNAGSVVINGMDISEYPIETKRLLGYLPEGAPAYPDMTVYQFLRFVAEVRGYQGAERDNVISKVVSQTNLGTVLHQSIETLSKGFTRRVGLAQAILHNPPIYILDEPTDGLDPNQKHEVRNLISNLAQDKVVILSTHILEEVEAVCNRIIVIAGGKLVADSTPQELAARSPKHNTVALTVRTDNRQQTRQQLEKLNGITQVDSLQDANRSEAMFCLHPQNGYSPFKELNRLAEENNWEIVDLYTQQGRLDDVFRSITERQQQIN